MPKNIYIKSFKTMVQILVCIIVFFACENDIKKINSISNIQYVPTMVSEKNEMIYTDSANLKYIVTAPIFKIYGQHEHPYWEFPEGIVVKHFDVHENLESIISADYAKYYEKKALWEARGNVEAKNIQSMEEMLTEECFWNQQEGIIYSYKHTRIITEDGIYYGKGGFESNDNFTKWELKNVKQSEVNIKDTEETSTENE